MRRLPCLLLLGLALASCGEEDEASAPASAQIVAMQRGEDCPTTRLPEPAFVPPAPYPAGAPPAYDRSWYGTERLWTWLRADGTWPMAHQDGVYFDKSFWWHPPGVERPRLRVTGRRLDAPAPPVDITTPAWTSSRYDLGEFMLVGLELPERGCWEVTGHYGAEQLSFVVRVTRG